VLAEPRSHGTSTINVGRYVKRPDDAEGDSLDMYHRACGRLLDARTRNDPNPGFSTRLEHTVAYLIAGIAVFIAYPRKPIWSIAAVLCAYAGILELGQIYIPGRHAAFLDWIASSSGVLCASMTVFFQRRHHATANR